MNIVIWIVIILVAVFLIWLLRRWIRRLIFIAILLIIAFFIYGLFSPSGAAKLWYNVRTFPDRVISRFSDKNFIDYNAYKLDFTSVGAKDKSKLSDIDSDLDSETGNDLDVNSDSEIDVDLNIDTDLDSDSNLNFDDDYEKSNPEQENKDIVIIENNQNLEPNQKDVIKSFGNLSPLRFVKMKDKIGEESEVRQDVSGYSKTDLIGIINTYIENNLTDDTEILVTIEYSETGEADKIILKTQPKYKSEDGVLSIPRLSLEKMIDGIYKSKYETVVIDDDIYEENIDLDDETEDKEDEEKKEEKKETKKEESKTDSVSEKDSSQSNNLIVEIDGNKEETKEEKNEEKKESSVTTVQNTTQKTTQTNPVKTTDVQAQPTTQKATTQKTTQAQTNTNSTTQKTTTQKTTQTQSKNTSNGLSQKDLRDAEEVLGVLF